MQQNSYPGKFIVFEGLDGSGQTTQANLLADALRKVGKEVVLAKEPTRDSEAGKRIRNVLDKKETWEPLELQRLFAQDRKDHLEKVIIPALQQGTWVVCDRYLFSSLAFGTAAGAAFGDVRMLNDEFLLPDATILLQVRPSLCMERIAKRGKPFTLFEDEQKMQRIWAVYQTLEGQFANIHIINGEQAIEKVSQTVWQIISPPRRAAFGGRGASNSL